MRIGTHGQEAALAGGDLPGQTRRGANPPWPLGRYRSLALRRALLLCAANGVERRNLLNLALEKVDIRAVSVERM